MVIINNTTFSLFNSQNRDFDMGPAEPAHDMMGNFLRVC
jgi:hypothetical protein